MRDAAKAGLHGKDGKKESWRGDIKGRAVRACSLTRITPDLINFFQAGLMGKGESSNALQNAQSHHSRPLAALKDPNTFGPPPKHIQTYGGVVRPSHTMSDTDGSRIPTSYGHTGALEERDSEDISTREGRTAQQPPQPPGPYRVDTTGLPTRSLPKPPGRRVETNSESIPIGSLTSTKPKPSLPPRLPPRQNSATISNDPLRTTKLVEPPPQKSYLNPGALSRLGSAGISVPGLGIGKNPEAVSSGWDHQSPPSVAAPPSSLFNQGAGMNELQGRFSKLSSPSTLPQSSPVGTSFAQKQAALKTVNSFRNNPSSVSLADARNAASTANNFRERHGDQVAAGWQGVNKLNTEYGITDRISSPGLTSSMPSSHEVSPPAASPVGQAPFASGGQKKAPPPPPPKKVQFEPGSATEPPPIPLSSKPRT